MTTLEIYKMDSVTILVFLLIIILLIGGGEKLRLNVKSKTSGESYIAEKKINSSGYKISDWYYLYSNGSPIDDKELEKSIFEGLVDEDWYGGNDIYMT